MSESIRKMFVWSGENRFQLAEDQNRQARNDIQRVIDHLLTIKQSGRWTPDDERALARMQQELAALGR